MDTKKPETTYEFGFRVTRKLPAQALADIITTAIEGGVNDWARVLTYRWENLPPEDVHAVIQDVEDDSVPEHPVTVAVIYQGLKRILEGDVKYNLDEGDSVRAMAESFILSGDAGEIEAGDADDIVQAALFGELRYG